MFSSPLEQTRAYHEIHAIVRADCEAEGKTEAYARGKTEGKVDSLKRVLTRRFGDLPPWALLRLEAASLEQLDG